MKEFKDTIEILTRFMLEGRFEPSVPKKKKVDKLALRGKAKKQHSIAFLAYFDALPPLKTKQLPLLPLDVIKFYKTLEVFILRRK